MRYVLNESRDSQVPVTRTMTIVLDGYNAPVSAGCFLDLVNKQWYDGMEIQRADGFVVQTGKPEGKQEGYVDPDTGKLRLCVSSPPVPSPRRTPRISTLVYRACRVC